MVSSYPDATGNSNTTRKTVGIDALKPLPGIVVLPSLGTTDASVSQRHEVNPAIALNLLQDIQSMVSLWRDQLRQIVRSLHSLQAQGPMVEGWLESSADAVAAVATDSTLLRHGDVDTLMRYVESLEGHSSEPAEYLMTQYRLCRLDDTGQLRSQLCPPEQLGIVSMAIARYQKYKLLLLQKQAIESKLQRAVNQLTEVRTALREE